MTANKSCILLFVKYPEKGKVKTRLAKTIGDKHARNIYLYIVKGVLKKTGHMKSDLIICYNPSSPLIKYKKWLGEDLPYISQEGHTLGDKMKDCLNQAFKLGYKKAILAGSDIPDIDDELLSRAFSSLNKNDAVIGPSRDGGYYLIGFKKDSFFQDVFKKINWSTDSVFSETVNVLNKRKVLYFTLPVLADIDIVEDLYRWYLINHDYDHDPDGLYAYVEKNENSIFLEYILKNGKNLLNPG